VIIVRGQVNEPDFNFIMERIITEYEEDIDLEELGESLLAIYNRPIDLNKASRADMQAIPFLSEEEILKILNFRNEYGLFLSSYELFLIDSLDSVKTDMLLPFVKTAHHNNYHDTIPLLKNIIRTSRKSMIVRYSRLLQEQKGFINRKIARSIEEGQFFTGSRDYVYGRFEIHEANDFDIGITFEKDAGEAFYINPKQKYYGFDHYAGYFRLHNRGLLREFTIGDFQMHYGEGLVMGRGFMNKGSETISCVRNRYNGSRPFQGASESGFLRGITISLGNRFFNCTGFGSWQSLDARILFDTTTIKGKNYYVSGLSSSGYHRTPAEINAKNILDEYTAGLHSQYLFPDNNLTIGATIAYNFWDYPIRTPATYYNQFGFSGSENLSGGVYYNFYKGKFNAFGEIANSFGKGYGFVQGFIANIQSNFETVIHLRYFSPGYFSKYGKPFSEYSDVNNERGIYWGVKIIPLPRLEVRGYIDIFRSDWLRYNIASPSTGYEVFFNLRYQPKTRLNLAVTFKNESKYRNDSQDALPIYTIVEGIKSSYKFSVHIQPLEYMKLQTRVQGSRYILPGIHSTGYALAQDVAVEVKKWNIKSRVAYFLTDDYFNRQYMYEHDVLYAYNMPAYQGHGIRTYVILKYSPCTMLDVWLKASQFKYFNRDEIGSGLTMISDNKKSEIKCQVRIKF
jgi:hypothetical protein